MGILTNIFEWLVLMQHYGAPTRLIDFTMSPTVALYFAFRNIHKNGGALWVLNPDKFLFREGEENSKNLMLNKLLSLEQYKLYFQKKDYWINDDQVNSYYNSRIKSMISKASDELFPLIPNFEDNRVIAQQGCFMIQGDLSTSIDDLGKTKSEFNSDYEKFFNFLRPTNKDVLNQPDLNSFSKIKLPFEWKKEALSFFKKINLNYSVLFPGVSGVGGLVEDYLNTRYYLRPSF